MLVVSPTTPIDEEGIIREAGRYTVQNIGEEVVGVPRSVDTDSNQLPIAESTALASSHFGRNL